MKGSSQRQLRAGELVRHALTDILRREEFADPDLRDRSITISEVRLSPDLQHARAFCAPLGGEDMEKVVAGLNRASKFIRGRLAREVEFRSMPTIRFVPDESFAEGERMDRLLASLRPADSAADADADVDADADADIDAPGDGDREA